MRRNVFERGEIATLAQITDSFILSESALHVNCSLWSAASLFVCMEMESFKIPDRLLELHTSATTFSATFCLVVAEEIPPLPVVAFIIFVAGYPNSKNFFNSSHDYIH